MILISDIKREPTYIGIVIDMTVSTQNSQAVTDWITECVFGNDDSCGISPSGGWTVTWFNDQSTNYHPVITKVALGLI